ncbi:hypothetical protein [Flagellimonas sp. SN16]|uniref:hypothetical protein n=1 Tax=Flagellimonas sp. SN16 TaxID=3415142 RepID=UPI003C37890E
MNTVAQITEKEVTGLEFPQMEIELDHFDNVKDGTEYQLHADVYDIDYGDYMVRCFGFKLDAMNDERPDFSVERLELWGLEDEIELTNEQAYMIEQKVRKSLNAK